MPSNSLSIFFFNITKASLIAKLWLVSNFLIINFHLLTLISEIFTPRLHSTEIGLLFRKLLEIILKGIFGWHLQDHFQFLSFFSKDSEDFPRVLKDKNIKFFGKPF